MLHYLKNKVSILKSRWSVCFNVDHYKLIIFIYVDHSHRKNSLFWYILYVCIQKLNLYKLKKQTLTPRWHNAKARA